MSNQLELFSPHREPLAPPPEADHRRQEAAARRSDPESSHEAARSVEASGAARDQRERASDLVFMAPGSTIHELAALSKTKHGDNALDHIQLARRLPESAGAKTGELRKCRVTNRKCQTWWPVD